MIPAGSKTHAVIMEDVYMKDFPHTALITGASGEIGRAVAEALAVSGCHLWLGGLTRGAKLTEYCSELSARTNTLCRLFLADVSDPASCERAFGEIRSLDFVINCAGIAHFSLLQDTGEEDWNRVIGTDLTGPFHILRRALPLLFSSSDPRILNISSVWGSHSAPTETAYSAAKGGLDALTRSLAGELAPSGIPVNAIACGVIDTAMNRDHFSEDELEDLRSRIPMGRFGAPEEVADLAVAILQAPRYLTGQIITLDGGWKI